jgi:DNA-binding NarL/FixJ family response regulator
MPETTQSPKFYKDRLRTLVVEDNPAFIMQIEEALSRLAPASQTVTFELGSQAIEFLFSADRRKDEFDLVLIDIGLPDMSGIDIIRAARVRMPDTPILVISVLKSEATLLKAIRTGARGYILKSESAELISHSIGEVLQGNYPVSPSLARSLFRLAGAPQADPDNDGFQMSRREKQVLQLIALGASYQEVATRLGVSLSTVQTYVRTLYRKLDVHNRQAAVNRGREIGAL